MREQDNLEVPSFGPADPSRATPAAETKLGDGVIARSVDAEHARKGRGFIVLVVLLLTAVVAGLGYWGLVQHNQIQQQQALLNSQAEQVTNLSGQITELQKLLQTATTSVEESDESLLEWVNNRASAADEKIQSLSEQLAKLEADLKKQTADQLAAQDAALKKLTADTSGQTESLTTLTSRLAAVEKLSGDLEAVNKAAADQKQSQAKLQKDLAALNSGLDKQVKALNSKLASVEKSLAAQDKSLKAASKKLSGSSGASAKQLEQVRADLAALSADYQILSEGQELQRVALAEQARDLNRRIDQAGSKGGASSSDLERRVSLNEQAVKAIDGSRLVMNKELLRIRQRLNNLQLQVESLQ